jgi:uncharacterized protein (TIGR00251 family)
LPSPGRDRPEPGFGIRDSKLAIRIRLLNAESRIPDPVSFIFTVRVIPRSSKPGIAGTRDDALLVRLKSPPVEGAANSELIDVIAKSFGVARRDITIVAGDRARLKRVAIARIDEARAKVIFQSLGIDPDVLSKRIR